MRAARYYLGVGKYTPNSAVQGDTGWKPTIVRQWSTVLNQLSKIMDSNRLNRKIFDFSNGRCQNLNYRVNKMLEEAGLQYQPGINPAILKRKSD